MSSRFFVLIFTLLTSILALAQERPIFQPGVEFIIFAEQKRISRDLDTARIFSPHVNTQDPAYAPEKAAVFEVKTYWVDASAMHGFFSEDLPADEKQLWERKVDGRLQYRILVHPESESFYEDFLTKTPHVEKAEPMHATATSSSRTLLIWPSAQPEKAFFGKLSLNREIGGFMRTIPVSETARSVGVTNVLHSEAQNLPPDFKFFPEVFGLIPKGMDRGGMIIRKIPKEVASGEKLAVPLFALYGQTGPNEAPLLAQMIADSGMSAESFIQHKIIRPFVKQWLFMENALGITMEPHAQNVLIGLTPEMKLDGNFYHRDFGGFSLDLAYREKIGRPRPALPSARGVDRDYHQVSEDKNYKLALPKGIVKFFSAGFLYNLDQKVPDWEKRGWIAKSSKKISEKYFERMLADEVARAMDIMSKGRIPKNQKQEAHLRRSTLVDQIMRLREMTHPGLTGMSNSCNSVFAPY